MASGFDFWGLLAGISLFLFAMSQLEAALKSLGGRSLATYLKRQSQHRFRAVFGGLVGTALLQSSSVVGLMVLAFVGAGLLSLGGALGVIFGSNLGTTFTGWIVATLGFKVELGALSLPLIALGGGLFLFGKGRWVEGGKALLGMGLLLMGLGFMKSAVASLEDLIDVADLVGLAPWQYLLFGVVVAAIIQSSSATMMITLAALNEGIISLPNAAAIAIGADLGTTTTVLLGAVKGSVAKQQVAAGHVMFNVVTDLVAFALLLPLLAVVAAMGIDDPLYSLVAFHSLFNLIGLCLFIPFTDQFAALLQRWFRAEPAHAAKYLLEAGSKAGEAALQATESEAAALITRVLRMVAGVFEPPLRLEERQLPLPLRESLSDDEQQSMADRYRHIKKLEGEILDFTVRLQTRPLDHAESARLSQLLMAVREATHAAKSLKDIAHNFAEFRESTQAIDAKYRQFFRADMEALFGDIAGLSQAAHDTVDFEELVDVLRRMEARHDQVHEEIYTDISAGKFRTIPISTVLNVNRELLISGKALILALAHYYLDDRQAESIVRLPYVVSATH